MDKKKAEAKVINLFQDTPLSALELLSKSLTEIDQELDVFFEKNKIAKSK